MGVLHGSDIGQRHKTSNLFKRAVQRLLHQRSHQRPEVNEQPLSLPVAKAAQADGGAEKIHHKGV